MATLTALEILQAVVNELGLPEISTLTTNDPTVRQILALANRAGDELYQAHQWVQSQIQYIVEIGTPVITTGDIAANSTTISNIPTTAGITANYFAVSGTYVMQSARVIDVVDGTTVTIDEPATATEVGADLIFARDTFEMPADFAWFMNRTMWDRTNQWELIGPMSPQADQWQRSGIVALAPRRRWRQVGLAPTNWRIWPPPSASNDYPATLVFEYESRYWALDDAGERIAKLSSDDDLTVIDAQAIILSTKWRLWAAKGFNYGAMQVEYLDYVSRLAARDGGAPDLSLQRPGRNYHLLGPDNIQDGSFPAPTS